MAGTDGAPPPAVESWRPDYEALRRGVGALALGRDVVEVRGADAGDYLQGQLSQDVGALEVGAVVDSLLLTPQGKLDALVRVARVAEDRWCLDTGAGFGEVVAARLRRFKLRVKVDIEPLAWGAVAVRGPDTATVVSGAGRHRPGSDPPGGDDGLGAVAVVAPVAWNGVEGVDLLGEAPQVPPGVALCAPEAGEAVRVEAGIPAMGSELDDRTIAAEAGLLERTVSFTKGCYTGQELVARLDARGNKVARHLRGVVLAPGDPAAGTGAWSTLVGADLVHDGRSVGSITSAAWSPTLGCPVALGYVHRRVEPPAAIDVVPPGGAAPVRGEIRTVPLV